MTAVTAGAVPQPLRRPEEGRVLGGVCTGLAERLAVDPLLIRIAFIGAAAAGGAGLLIYAVLWAILPGAAGNGRRLPARATVEIAAGAGLLALAALLALREIGWWFSDVIVWPVVLVAAGGVILWRQTGAVERGPGEEPVRPADRAAIVSRAGIGIALVLSAGVAFLALTDALDTARNVILALVAAVVVLGAIFAPLAARLLRSLGAERAERIRSQERAEMGAHLHDSVLQTLALLQRRADDPAEVAALARRQERELRSWLAGRAPSDADRLVAALEAAAGDVERDFGVAVEVVAVGDAELDEGRRALVAAAREAMVNAAKFGGGSTVDVFAEIGDERIAVFVRDRGPGFDPAAVPADRRGLRESVLGRMERHGGRAVVHSSPGQGTEVELSL